jgi:hypothetical protein
VSAQLSFVLINESTSASGALAALVTPAWLAGAASAVMVQLDRDFSPEWGGSYSVRAGAGATDIMAGEVVFAIVDALPTAPGAIAYHDVNGQGVPVAFLALSTCSTLDDVSTAISHECCEAGADQSCNLWADSAQGQEVANEVCDAVESTSYDVTGVKVSDFLLRSFFSPVGQAPYSFVQAQGGTGPSGPFQTAPGGYQIVRNSGTGETQVQGTIAASHKLAKAKHWSGRVYRRGARL